MVKTRTRKNQGCPHCNVDPIVVAAPRSKGKRKTILETHPHVLEYWHHEKNLGVDPKSLTRGMQKIAWWKCKQDPSHEWQASIYKQTSRKNQCQFCVPISSGIVPEEKSIAIQFPQLLDEWHPTLNAKFNPRTIGPGSGKRIWWICKIDSEHIWESFVFQRTKGAGCPYCGGQKADSKSSLAANHPEIAAQWHPSKNGNLKPTDVRRQSAQKVWWMCTEDESHVWDETVQNRVNRRNCPTCERQTRVDRINDALSQAVDDNVTYRETFEESIASLSKLVFVKIKDAESQQALYRLIHAGLIASMETFLSDSFINTVGPDQDLRNRLLKTTPEFQNRKYSVSEIVDWIQSSELRVKKYLLDVIYHNLFKVKHMFLSVLEIQFPEDDQLRELQKAIELRHHVVHRNGRDKTGKLTQLDIKSLDQTVKIVRQFVSAIDEQMMKRPWECEA